VPQRHADPWVVAIGGNALADPRNPFDLARQQEKANALAGPLVDVLASGTRLVIVHGNGPQVGARLIQGEAARAEVPAQPLYVCVAETQAEIGHYISSALVGEARGRSIDVRAITLVTHVLVDEKAPEFERPDKPVGPSYDELEARGFANERGWRIAETSRSVWRRVVASPRPLAVVEERAIGLLLDGGYCVIAGGGGGVPMTAAGSSVRPVEAVVDKDYAAAKIGTAIGASRLIVLTDVPGAAISFSGREQRFLSEISADEAGTHLARGEFAPGSMGPKVEACIEFVEGGGDAAIIASIEDAVSALAGHAGTRIVRSRR
jgi:carbamate kinase